MKYKETDLTEAAKIIFYLRSLRMYAIVILIFGVLYFGFKIYSNTKGLELYLLDSFIIVLGLASLVLFIRLNAKTAALYGAGSVIAGILYSFTIVYYRGEADTFVTGIGLLAGFILMRQGVKAGFSYRTREAFTKGNQKKIAFVIHMLSSLKQSRGDETDVIRCTYSDEGKSRNLDIKLLDDVACFVLQGHAEPIFFDRNNVFISLLQKKQDVLDVSISVDNHDWLEAQLRPDDFKKYEAWKDL